MLVFGPLAILMSISPIRATGVLVEGQASNLAVGRQQPLFEWRVDDKRPDALQTAYELSVQGPGVEWSTGKVESGNPYVIYSGPSLKTRAQYTVKLRLWDAKGDEGDWSQPVPFRTQWLGKDWKAEWIQGQVKPPKIVKPHNGYHSEMERSGTVEKWVEVDIGMERNISSVRLYPSQPIDWSPPTYGFLFPLRYHIEVEGKVVASRDDEDQPVPTKPVDVTFPPVKGQKVKLVVTKLRERNEGYFGMSLAELQVNGFSGEGFTATAKDGLESAYWGIAKLVDGDTVSHGIEGYGALPTHVLLKDFDLKAVPKSSLMHVAALGSYQLTINGHRVDDAALTPDWTDYHTRVGVQTYEVAKHLKQGSNKIQILLGDGWYAGRLGMSQGLFPDGRPRGVYGRVPMVRAELELPGESIYTDTSWRFSIRGPVRTSDILDGEVFDANFPGKSEQEDHLRNVIQGKPDVEPELDPQIAEPIKVTQTVKPIGQHVLPDGRVVLDFGQNLVGRARFHLSGKAGDEVKVHYGEMLSDDGSLYTPNLRGAPQIDTFVMDGKEAWFTTHFTYHGFRYAEMTIPSKPAKVEAVAEVFHTSAPETAEFACSDPMFERLWQNIVWTQRANLMSVPTDCPQRDERLGWTGDIHAFGQTGCYIMDLRNFWRKWMMDMRDAQADDGRFADFAPHPYGKNDRFNGVPGWGDAGAVCPLTAYENYGDVRLAEESLPSIDRWLKWIESKNPDHIWRNDRHNDYGDWLNGDTLIQAGWPKKGAECPKDVFATLMWFQSACASDELAKAVGKPAAGHASMAGAVQQAFVKEFVDADGKIKGDTQAGYAIALGLNILPKELQEKAFSHLVDAIKRADDHLSTGFHSTHHLMQVLTRFGRSDLAYKILSNKTFPGWGYTIENGATTIWERWDGFVKGRGFQDPGMNSFNHWAFGSVGEWMMNAIIGIRPGTPGWRRFVVSPEPGGGLSWAKGHYDSPAGRIAVSWKVVGDELKADVTIPANTRAKVRFPTGWTYEGAKEIGSGNHTLVAKRMGN